MQSKATPALAREASDRLADSETIERWYETEARFDAVGDALRTDADHDSSFTDHVIAVTTRERNVEHILASDGDFEPLGLTVVLRSSNADLTRVRDPATSSFRGAERP